MSCNPAIGGIAKGIVVKEVDVLGGIMGRAADRSTIQFRMLNRSKGPAVWSPRAQCDRGLYRRAVRSLLEERHNLLIWQGTVHRLLLDGDSVRGVVTQDGNQIRARSVILTAGTFLRGRIHVGHDAAVPAGRAGDAPVVDLAEQLESLGLEVGRFKTGTPPRIDGRSVDFSRTERQDGDTPNYRFAQYVNEPRPNQLPCWITWAGTELKEIIQENLQYSALYGGEIAGRGPRYCPSVEDKVVKFPDAERHQVFLEPEGLETSELYVNGLSTSLPVEVQKKFLRSVPGLEKAVMTRAGYAIEYDYYPPQQLTPWLEVKALAGLFFAGQINGTTGYEEAAGQGVLAGINGVRRGRGEEPVVVTRDTGYLGVLVDDLITRGVDEPYRLFTSRAEYRLLLRQDNVLRRLGGLARTLGLLDDAELEVLDRRLESEDVVRRAAERTVARPGQVAPYFSAIGEAQITESQRLSELVKRPAAELKKLFECLPPDDAPQAAEDAWVSVQVEFKYAGYIAREHEAARKLSELAHFELPHDLPYVELTSLSIEARQKLARVRPGSLAQAGRIPGVSPSDLQNLIAEVLKRSRPRRDPALSHQA
jgi:tRNA uridine 5-carboxymethylaminomethyl modification enzyme